MSFILDALKKSESDRARDSGPALFEVRVAAPRTTLPPWAIAVAALLLVNLAVVAWMLLRHPAGAPAASGIAPAVSAAAAPSAGPPLSATAASPPPALTAVPAPASAAEPAPPPAPRSVPATPPAPGVTASAAAPSATSGAAPAGQPPAAAAATGSPDDYRPAAEPAPVFGARVQRGTAAGVPLYQDAASGPGAQLPQLRLDLHVYAARAQDRFVMINMHRLHEGDALPEGVRVDSITPEGAVLSYNGARFLLTRD
jgi:general secretion pathway protein B